MHPRDFFRSRKAFTLIELLVVIAIIAILAVVVVLTLNPAQLLAQSRDANRVSDMATLNSAIGLYQTDTGGTGLMGTSSIVYASLPDSSLTCGSWNLPALASSNYQCSSSTSSRLTNNQGWIPINFSQISSGAPFGSLPVDPVNASSSGLYYSYVTSGTQYMVTALPESQKQKQVLGQKPMVPNYPDVIANGSNLNINPLYNQGGLVGYWPMDEGTGTTTQDMSGGGNNGIWTGPSYSAGKVGPYAGNFNANFIQTGTNNFPIGNSPRSVFAWVYYTGSINNNYIIFAYGNYNAYQTSILLLTGSTNPSVAFADGNGGSAVYGAAISQNSWYSVGYTYDGTTCVVYINGVFSNSGVPGSLSANTNSSNIGKNVNNGTSYIFTGLIDDLRIYNRALSAAEVQAIYNAEK